MKKLVVTDLGIEDEPKNEQTRHWYKITGYHDGYNRTFTGDTYAVCSGGAILDGEGYPLTSGDWETEAVRQILEACPVSTAAAILGQRGGRVKSPRKAETSRKNGNALCHDGKRRGRPRKEINNGQI